MRRTGADESIDRGADSGERERGPWTERGSGANRRGASRPALLVGLVLLVCTVAAGPASAFIRAAQTVVSQGQAMGGSTVSSLNTPFTDGMGRVTLVLGLADSQRAIWWDSGPIFFSSQAAPDVLSGAESCMGATDRGRFAYSPSVNGLDAIYTDQGSLLKEGDPFPPLPGKYSSFNSRPTMLPDGQVYWIAGISNTQGGATVNRALVRAPDSGSSSEIEWVLGGLDIIEGDTIRAGASNLDFSISDNGLHHLHILDTSGPTNERLYRDGTFVAVEGGDAGGGTHWSHFVQGFINNSGDYIFFGSTDGDPARDWFIGWNGEVRIREGDVVGEIPIPAGANVTAVSLSNSGRAAFIWTGSGFTWVFYGTGPDLAGCHRALAIGDSLETNGAVPADYAVVGIIASPVVGPGLDVADDGRLFVRATIRPPGGEDLQAIIGLRPDVADAAGLPIRPAMLECRPNPFRGSTTVLFDEAAAGPARMSVCDPAGRLVRLLSPGTGTAGAGSGGPGSRVWDGRDALGRPVASGVYFLVMEGKDGPTSTRVIRTR